MMVDIDADTTIDLAPHLKQVQLNVMSNGDNYVPILPKFVIYCTRLGHGREPSQVSTEVLGVKCVPQDSKLLGNFLRAWHPKPAPINVLEYFYLKAQSTYLDCKPMNKSSRTTIFS